MTIGVGRKGCIGKDSRETENKEKVETDSTLPMFSQNVVETAETFCKIKDLDIKKKCHKNIYYAVLCNIAKGHETNMVGKKWLFPSLDCTVNIWME